MVLGEKSKVMGFGLVRKHLKGVLGQEKKKGEKCVLSGE